MKKALTYFVALLFVIPLVAGFSCTKPIGEFDLINGFDVLCTGVNSSSECYSYIYERTPFGELVGAYPKPEVKDLGVTHGFAVVGNSVIVTFKSSQLETGTAYTFGVLCGNERYEFNNSVSVEDASGIARGGKYINDYVYWFAVFVLVLVIAGMGVRWLYEYYKSV